MSEPQLTRNRIMGGKLLASGLLLAGLGLAALLLASEQPFRLPSGRPGPGFVPNLLAACLLGLGLLHAVVGRAAPTVIGVARAGAMLCGAVAAFALLLPVAGFLPACWATGSLALTAAPGWRLPTLLAVGALIATVAAVLFVGLLGAATPLIGPR